MSDLKRNKRQDYSGTRRPQRGITLILALLFLWILSIIGLVAMNGSGLELKMSANALQKTVSFQESEDARELAEEATETVVSTMKAGGAFPTSIAGYYDVTGGKARPNIADSDFWSDANASNYVSVNANNKYVIEYLGRKTVVLDDRTTSELVYVFRLSMLGVGLDGVSHTLAQTVHMAN